MHVALGDETLFIQRYGRGRPMLVLHGGPGLDHSYMRPYLDAVGDCAELIYVDLPGQGRSSGREAMANATFERWAADVYALTLALKLQRPIVFGHGFGGIVAQLYAKAYPHALQAAVLSNTFCALDYPATMFTAARDYGGPDAMAALMACMTQPMADDASMRAVWRRALPLYFYRFQPMFGASIDDGMIYSAAAYNRGMFELVGDFSSAQWLGRLDRPTLILGGAHDWMAPQKEALTRLAKGLPNSQTVVFDHSGHFPFIEETTAFCHALRRFIRGLE